MINARGNRSFKDKVVIITGSSKGIGKAIAFEFLKAGVKVVLNGRNQDNLSVKNS
jgi:3-oxoacyl-[acyl-carrier protein] reductase